MELGLRPTHLRVTCPGCCLEHYVPLPEANDLDWTCSPECEEVADEWEFAPNGPF